MARQALDAKEPTKKSLFVWKHLEGQHDQSSHGSWAGTGSTEASAEEIAARRFDAIKRGEIPDYKTGPDGRIENPDATGGYKAGIPESVQFGGQTFTPKDSLWHHLVPDGQGGYEPSQERALLHQQIIAEVTGNVPESANPTFYMLGGGPASGKTTVIKSGLTDIPDKTRAVHINADDAKEMLPENTRMRMSQDDRDFFHAAEFTHEESSILAKRIQNRAIENRQDIVLDGTGDSAITKLAKKVETASQEGYKVHGVYVTIPTDMAWDRAVGRALGSSHRYVPESVVRTTHKDVSVTLPLAIEGGLFDSVSLFDNTSSTVKKIGQGFGNEFVIYDADGWRDFLAKGKG
jgi:predicted ABC-type ATPase